MRVHRSREVAIMNIAAQISGASKAVCRAVTEDGAVEPVAITDTLSIEGSWEGDHKLEAIVCFLRLVKTTPDGREEVASARGRSHKKDVAALLALGNLGASVRDALRVAALLRPPTQWMAQTEEQKEQFRTGARARWAARTEEQKEAHRVTARAYKAAMEPEAARVFAEKRLIQQRARKAKRTPEEVEADRARNRAYSKKARRKSSREETPEQRKARLDKLKERRDRETPEQREARRAYGREYTRKRRAAARAAAKTEVTS